MKRAAMAVLVVYALSACAVQGPIHSPHEQDVISMCQAEAAREPNTPQAVYYNCMQRWGIDPNGTLPSSADNASTGVAVAGGVLAGIAAVVLTAALLAAGSTPCCYYPHHSFHHWHH